MSERKTKFQKLTPIHDAEIGIYGEALNYVFDNNDLRNVAISGAYSAGKSSVLESYKKMHLNKVFLHISLAHFQSEENGADTNNSTSDADEVKESVLEGKILNQLIHQISPKLIPQTNFRVKQKVSSKKLACLVTAVIFFVLLFLHILFFSSWQSYVNNITVMWIKNTLSFTAENSSLLISGVICIALAAILMYYISKTQMNKGIFKKISADKLEIEIFEGSDDSYFDKYLNEVLYLFDQCGADVIVFEDMDRYNANRIFERLREVNALINVQRCKEEKDSPLRFFYLLRDDIFVSKDRTKFFDFIIPVIPVVDGSNSYDQFIKHLSDSGTLELFEEPFLQGLSLYIDDMRILKNICNEFAIYNSRLNITELNPNKLMAIIAYKNLFPRDFSDLQLGRGFVFTLFDQKERFIATKITQLDDDLLIKKEKLNAIKKEHLTSIQELDLVTQNKRDAINSRSSNYRQKKESLEQLDAEYLTRKEAIENHKIGNMPKLEEDIQRIESAIARTQNEALQNIITRENIDELFAVTNKNEIGFVADFKDIRGNDYFSLLKYLIRNGYIDESYADYMTYFYEHSLSRTDKIFLRSVSDQIKKEYSYQLKEPKKVFARLNVSVFDEPEILNYDLLFYLLKECAVDETTIQYPANIPAYLDIELEGGKEQQCLLAMIEQILRTRMYSFLQSVFIDIKGDKLNYLVNLLNSIRKDCLTNILLNKAEFAGNCRNDFVLRTLIVTPDRDLINEEDLKNALSIFISNYPHFIDKDNVAESRLKELFGANVVQKLLRVSLIERFKLLQVRFSSLDYESADTKLFDAVYENNLYKLSFFNIGHLLKTKYEIEESDDFKHKNYTLIKEQPDSPLAMYIESEIDNYVIEILTNCDKRVEDDEVAALEILNNIDVSAEHKSAYIAALKTKIHSLSDVTDESLWKELVTSNLVVHIEMNVIDYFVKCGNSLVDELIQFIDRDEHKYDFTKTRKLYEKDVQRAFFNAVVRCCLLSDVHYGQFLATFGWCYIDSFNVEGIPKEKIDILIDTKIVKMSEASLNFIRLNYPLNLIHYIVANIEEYCDLVDEAEIFIADEGTELLAEHISDKFKLKLLGNIKNQLTAINIAYSDEIKAAILTNNFDKSDLPHFVSHYDTEGEKTKAVIILKVFEWVRSPFDEPLPISVKLFDVILASDKNNSLEEKIILFSCLLPTLNEAQCKNYLSKLKLYDFLGLFEQKRPKIAISNTNERILRTFQHNRWITKYEIYDKNTSFYRAYGRKMHLSSNGDDIVLL